MGHAGEIAGRESPGDRQGQLTEGLPCSRPDNRGTEDMAALVDDETGETSGRALRDRPVDVGVGPVDGAQPGSCLLYTSDAADE